ncbi:hypothetical protein HDU79_006214 [Rhizoclosmatium sp. JEL0117]|nr:hypothetical protein HDU79_006214 [Rhizoclosmatium sp. JEL0117]
MAREEAPDTAPMEEESKWGTAKWTDETSAANEVQDKQQQTTESSKPSNQTNSTESNQGQKETEQEIEKDNDIDIDDNDNDNDGDSDNRRHRSLNQTETEAGTETGQQQQQQQQQQSQPPKPRLVVDRKTTPPFLVKVFCGPAHRDPRDKKAFAQEEAVLIHTWRDATLRELACLLADHKPDLLITHPESRLSFRAVFPDPANTSSSSSSSRNNRVPPPPPSTSSYYKTKDLGHFSNMSKRYTHDEFKTLDDFHWVIGDFLDVSVVKGFSIVGASVIQSVKNAVGGERGERGARNAYSSNSLASTSLASTNGAPPSISDRLAPHLSRSFVPRDVRDSRDGDRFGVRENVGRDSRDGGRDGGRRERFHPYGGGGGGSAAGRREDRRGRDDRRETGGAEGTGGDRRDERRGSGGRW